MNKLDNNKLKYFLCFFLFFSITKFSNSQEKNYLNWNSRIKKLKDIVKRYKSKSRKNYDCIVPISCANDSHFIVYIVKEVLKLNPLLVHYNKYFNTPLGIKNIANLKICF